MKHTRDIWICLPLMLAANCVQAQTVAPTDTDLRSIYCVQILQSEIGEEKAGQAQLENSLKQAQIPSTQKFLKDQLDDVTKWLANAESALERLQSYVLPRWMNFDPVPALLAMNRGKDDWKAFIDMSAKCTAKCSTLASGGKSAACWESCPDKDLVARVQSCLHPTWLPF